MPSSVGSALLLFGLVLGVADAETAAITSGALGVGWELVLLYFTGRDGA